MKILLINTYDKGGAANSCFRLHNCLLKKGIDSNVLLRIKSGSKPNSFAFYPPPQKLSGFKKIENKFKRLGAELKIYKPANLNEKSEFLKRRPGGLEMFSFPNSGINITQSSLYAEADIVNLHWAANFLDYQSFFKHNKKPVVWTLHDMNPFTGGEHYIETFLGMDEKGNPIPRKYSEEEREIEASNLEIKKKALAHVENLTIVAPSKWLASQAQKSDLFRGRPIHIIPYGLDPEIYTLRDKNFSREVLGIPREKIVFLFVADSISNFRKGFPFLTAAIKRIRGKEILLCVIGSNDKPQEEDENILNLGSLYDERLMSMAYSAADAFVIPSLIDNLPNTVLESLMCGTPVIGFPVGGIKDMIENGENGLLTEETNVISLVKALKDFMTEPARFDNENIRNAALKKYHENIQAEEYIKLFKKLKEDNPISSETI